MTDRRTQGARTGFTLVETILALTIGTILILMVAVFLADSQKAFNRAYGGAFSTAAQDSFAARIIFGKTMRQACAIPGTAAVAPDGSWIQVQYYSDPNGALPDRVARFERTGQDLRLRRGVLANGQTLALETVCTKVTAAHFSLAGSSAQMFLSLSDGSSTQTVNTSAAMRSP